MAVIPVTPQDFARLMTAFRPFEEQPILAVAVSGGGDSMALLLLADGWARAQGGRAVALTVDHGLRPESGAEAAQVGAWAKARGIDHQILSWVGDKPAADIQAEARKARYQLMEDWCRANHVRHLLLAHHLEDQAETFLLRLARGSGVDGLAAMSPLVEKEGVRLMRPLLGAPKESLLEVLRLAKQEWIDDPSNSNDRFARVRMRKLAASLAAEGLTPKRLAGTADAMARVRESLELETAKALQSYARFSPLGYASFDRDGLGVIPPEIALRFLRDLVMVVGGQSLPPRLDRLERLLYALLEGPIAATAGGCRITRDCLVVREDRHVAEPISLEAGKSAIWDGRFRVSAGPALPNGIQVGALGADGWRQLTGVMDKTLLPKFNASVRATLPALWHGERLGAVPLLGYNPGDVGDWGVSMTFLTRASAQG